MRMHDQDEIVKYSPHARAIRDVEDEELMNFFYGMSPWQVSSKPSINFFFFHLEYFCSFASVPVPFIWNVCFAVHTNSNCQFNWGGTLLSSSSAGWSN